MPDSSSVSNETTCEHEAGACSSCSTASCSQREAPRAAQPGEEDLARTIGAIRETIIVLSGKGGVGKSTVAVNIAVGLASEGYKVGLLDVDIHGPSIPTMLGIHEARLDSIGEKLLPLSVAGMHVVSIGLLLESKDDALIWRGPMKAGVIKQFLADVEWGPLDYLVVDCPPGTGDEPLSIIQLLPARRRALVVTTPQEVAAADVRKSLNFCTKLQLPVLGVVENMSGFVCPHCQTVTEIFRSGGGERMAADFNVPFLGKLPVDPGVASSGDDGKPFIYHKSDSPAARAFQPVLRPILALLADTQSPETVPQKKETTMKRFAIPTASGRLCAHFGHCESFALIEADTATKTIGTRTDLVPPPHEPGVLPKWLGEQGVNVIIAGGMGQRAQELFTAQGIAVCVGAPADEPEALVAAWLNKTLVTGANACDH